MDWVDNESNPEAKTRHVAVASCGSPCVSGGLGDGDMDYGSDITAMSEELVEAVCRSLSMMETALNQAFV